MPPRPSENATCRPSPVINRSGIGVVRAITAPTAIGKIPIILSWVFNRKRIKPPAIMSPNAEGAIDGNVATDPGWFAVT